MSNVLIGIIGVILFIGLALAGALFLGPRFSTADSSSRATALVAQAQQVAAANASFEANTGEVVGSNRNNTGVAYLAGYLKTPPSAWNTYAYTGRTVAYTYLSATDKNAKICEAVQRYSGQIGKDDPAMLATYDMGNAVLVWPMGCVLHSTGQYAVYSRI